MLLSHYADAIFALSDKKRFLISSFKVVGMAKALCIRIKVTFVADHESSNVSQKSNLRGDRFSKTCEKPSNQVW
jgi:hypothetical protein